jgi:hypothetical protein
MQPVATQLQQLNYSNGNGGIFYMVRAQEFSRRKLGTTVQVTRLPL